MSFGFDVGNFADAAHLAYLIYRDCYKVARGAPQEFHLLVSEISTLSSSLKILQEDVKDPESPLLQAGNDRVKLVNEMVENIRVTLNKMERIARKYEIMGSTTASKGKQMWTRFKWTFDWSTIGNLRSKLMQHNTMMNLLLTQVGNSSLQNIQSTTKALESDIHEIRKYMTAQQGEQVGSQERSKGTPTPFLSLENDESVVKDDISRSSLSAVLLKHAEMHQPWSTIGVSQWIETGTWWLLRAQLDVRAIVTRGSNIPTPAYAKLIKASWILIDTIACHPQIAFVSSSTRAQITALSTQIKQVFERIKISDLVLPKLVDIGAEDLYIWEASESKELLLRPQSVSSNINTSIPWAVEGDEQALFIRFAECNLTASGPNICMVLFLVQQDGRAMRIVAKRQNGNVNLDIPLTKQVKLQVESEGIVVNDQEILLDRDEDIEQLYCLIEAANIYLFERTSTYFSVRAFTIWALLIAAKHGCKELLSAWYTSLYLSSPAPVQHDDVESRLYQVTKSLARASLEGDNILGPQCKHHRGGLIDTEDLTLMYWAISIGNSSLVDLLMKEGVTVARRSWRERPLLHVAAYYGHEAVAHAIVANSSEDAKTLARERAQDGCQALCYAAFNGHENIASSLLEWGAEVGDVLTTFSQTALHVAAWNGHTKIVELLLDKGAKSDFHQMTPLLLACGAEREGANALSSKKKLDFDSRNRDGRTAWQLAINLRCANDREISQSTFDLIMQSFWAGQKPQTMPLPKQRRAVVSFEILLDTERVTLTLDSRYAKFEHPRPLPSQAIDRFGRCIDGWRPAGITNRLFRLTIVCHIIYACKTLDFSTTHKQLSRNGRGWIRLKIRGGGGFEASVRDINNPGFILQNHRNIATDPDAEEVSRAAVFW